MDIEKLMTDTPELANTLAERVMLRKPDGSPSIRKTPQGFDIGESYARHGLRVVERLAGRAESVEPAQWQETCAWYRDHSDFVLALVMQVETHESRKTAAAVQSLEARVERLQADNEALQEALANARREPSDTAMERLDALLPGQRPEPHAEEDTIRSMQRYIAELEARLEFQRTAATSHPGGPLLTVAGGAAAGWLIGKALTTPTKLL